MECRGGRTINPLCGEFWSLRCCTALVLLASIAATVTLAARLPSRVNVLLRSSGRPFFLSRSAFAAAAAATAAGAERSEIGQEGLAGNLVSGDDSRGDADFKDEAHSCPARLLN